MKTPSVTYVCAQVAGGDGGDFSARSSGVHSFSRRTLALIWWRGSTDLKHSITMQSNKARIIWKRIWLAKIQNTSIDYFLIYKTLEKHEKSLLQYQRTLSDFIKCRVLSKHKHQMFIMYLKMSHFWHLCLRNWQLIDGQNIFQINFLTIKLQMNKLLCKLYISISFVSLPSLETLMNCAFSFKCGYCF